MLRATVGRRRPTLKGKAPSSALPIKTLNSKLEKWKRPLPFGVLPAYDEALKLIWADSARLREQAAALAQQVSQTAALLPTLDGHEKTAQAQKLEEMRKTQQIMVIQSQVNDPEVRWACKKGQYDMGNAAHRHLREQKWRAEGKLDLLMERIHQMNVIPDVLADLRPTVDVSVTVRPPLIPSGVARVEPGSFVQPELTVMPPTVIATAFHTDTRLYTLLLVDADVPDEANETFTTYLHWLCPNVPLSARSSGPLRGINSHTGYVPPHPAEGIKYHRYSLLLLPQPPLTDYSLNTSQTAGSATTSRRLDIPIVRSRVGFNVRQFAKVWQLDGRNGGGAHMWRAVWNPSVDGLYKAIFKTEPPKYARPPRQDRYEQIRGQPKYISA